MNSDINFWGRQLIVGVMFGIVVFLFDRLTNMEHTKRKIKINLLYYLENILPNRMEKNLKKQNYEKNEKIKKSQSPGIAYIPCPSRISSPSVAGQFPSV